MTTIVKRLAKILSTATISKDVVDDVGNELYEACKLASNPVLADEIFEVVTSKLFEGGHERLLATSEAFIVGLFRILSSYMDFQKAESSSSEHTDNLFGNHKSYGIALHMLLFLAEEAPKDIMDTAKSVNLLPKYILKLASHIELDVAYGTQEMALDILFRFLATAKKKRDTVTMKLIVSALPFIAVVFAEASLQVIEDALNDMRPILNQVNLKNPNLKSIGGVAMHIETPKKRISSQRKLCSDTWLDFGAYYMTIDIVDDQVISSVRIFYHDMKKIVFVPGKPIITFHLDAVPDGLEDVLKESEEVPPCALKIVFRDDSTFRDAKDVMKLRLKETEVEQLAIRIDQLSHTRTSVVSIKGQNPQDVEAAIASMSVVKRGVGNEADAMPKGRASVGPEEAKGKAKVEGKIKAEEKVKADGGDEEEDQRNCWKDSQSSAGITSPSQGSSKQNSESMDWTKMPLTQPRPKSAAPVMTLTNQLPTKTPVRKSAANVNVVSAAVKGAVADDLDATPCPPLKQPAVAPAPAAPTDLKKAPSRRVTRSSLEPVKVESNDPQQDEAHVDEAVATKASEQRSRKPAASTSTGKSVKKGGGKRSLSSHFASHDNKEEEEVVVEVGSPMIEPAVMSIVPIVPGGIPVGLKFVPLSGDGPQAPLRGERELPQSKKAKVDHVQSAAEETAKSKSEVVSKVPTDASRGKGKGKGNDTDDVGYLGVHGAQGLASGPKPAMKKDNAVASKRKVNSDAETDEDSKEAPFMDELIKGKGKGKEKAPTTKAATSTASVAWDGSRSLTAVTAVAKGSAPRGKSLLGDDKENQKVSSALTLVTSKTPRKSGGLTSASALTKSKVATVPGRAPMRSISVNTFVNQQPQQQPQQQDGTRRGDEDGNLSTKRDSLAKLKRAKHDDSKENQTAAIKSTKQAAPLASIINLTLHDKKSTRSGNGLNAGTTSSNNGNERDRSDSCDSDSDAWSKQRSDEIVLKHQTLEVLEKMRLQKWQSSTDSAFAVTTRTMNAFQSSSSSLSGMSGTRALVSNNQHLMSRDETGGRGAGDIFKTVASVLDGNVRKNSSTSAAGESLLPHHREIKGVTGASAGTSRGAHCPRPLSDTYQASASAIDSENENEESSMVIGGRAPSTRDPSARKPECAHSNAKGLAVAATTMSAIGKRASAPNVRGSRRKQDRDGIDYDDDDAVGSGGPRTRTRVSVNVRTATEDDVDEEETDSAELDVECSQLSGYLHHSSPEGSVGHNAFSSDDGEEQNKNILEILQQLKLARLMRMEKKRTEERQRVLCETVEFWTRRMATWTEYADTTRTNILRDHEKKVEQISNQGTSLVNDMGASVNALAKVLKAQEIASASLEEAAQCLHDEVAELVSQFRAGEDQLKTQTAQAKKKLFADAKAKISLVNKGLNKEKIQTK